MYAKIFASLYQGTLRGNAHAILVFTNLLAHSDRDGVVDKHYRAIAEEVGLTIDDVKAALAYLEAPDPESRTPDAEGRRIVPIDAHRSWGWKIVNHAKYRDMRNEAERREQNRVAQENRRKKLSSSSVSTRQHASAKVSNAQHASAMSAHADADADAETNTKIHTPLPPKVGECDYGFEKWWELYRRKGNKIQSRKQWSKLKPDDIADAMARTPAYVESCRDRQYQKDGERFLKSRHWESVIDESAPAQSNSQPPPPPPDPWSVKTDIILKRYTAEEIVAFLGLTMMPTMGIRQHLVQSPRHIQRIIDGKMNGVCE